MLKKRAIQRARKICIAAALFDRISSAALVLFKQCEQWLIALLGPLLIVSVWALTGEVAGLAPAGGRSRPALSSGDFSSLISTASYSALIFHSVRITARRHKPRATAVQNCIRCVDARAPFLKWGYWGSSCRKM